MNLRPAFSLFLLLGFSLTSLAQNDSWLETNDGIAVEDETFKVREILRTQSKKVFACIARHSRGDDANGIYELDTISWQWKHIGEEPGVGFSGLAVDGNNIYNVRLGHISKFDTENNSKKWEFIVNVDDIGIPLQPNVNVVNDVAYFRSRMEGKNLSQNRERFPNENFQENEEFVIAVGLLDDNIEFLRNPNNPLIIENRGGNRNMSLVLQTGKVYLHSTFNYRDLDGYGGLYEWNGNDWVSASAGLDAINITGSGFGPTGPIYTDFSKTRLFIRTEQGFYEKVDGGWYKFFYRTGATFFITKNYMYIPNGNGNVLQIDRAVKINHGGNFDRCVVDVHKFMTPNEGGFFLAELESVEDPEIPCEEIGQSDQKEFLGIFRYSPTDGKRGRVQNLHIENGTYVGGRGANNIAKTAIANDNKIVTAGVFNSNMNAPVTTPLGVGPEGKGKILVMDEWGNSVSQSVVMGNAIHDMEVEETTGEIALIGDFGVAVLHQDYTLKWHQPEIIDSKGDAAYRPRLSIAENGYVVAVLKENVKLYDALGQTIHTNNLLYKDNIKIYDTEISSDGAHNQYYLCGYSQVNRNLQMAYLHAYALTPSVDRKWKTWGFTVGGENGVSLADNGADTRVYRVKVAPNGDVYAACESAGGGPGGFSVLAYNGKDVKTKIAHQGNDFFTDGTNSSGANHITFIGRINPNDGTVKKGKFFHTRLTNGRTNTHRVKDGDLDVDEEGNIYLAGIAAARIQDRDVFNINGTLIEPYAGGDQIVLTTTPNMGNRLLWGAFPKANRGGGKSNRIAARRGKVVYAATTTRGEMVTTDNAIQREPYNIVRTAGRDTLSATDVFLASWQSEVWKYANNDELTYPFISQDSCFRVDNKPCVTMPIARETPMDVVEPFNLISPNGDGQNDDWRIDNLQVLENYNIQVFDANGTIVFTTSDYSIHKWDGTRNGDPLPEGVYFYIIKAQGVNRDKTGYITLLR